MPFLEREKKVQNGFYSVDGGEVWMTRREGLAPGWVVSRSHGSHAQHPGPGRDRTKSSRLALSPFFREARCVAGELDPPLYDSSVSWKGITHTQGAALRIHGVCKKGLE